MLTTKLSKINNLISRKFSVSGSKLEKEAFVRGSAINVNAVTIGDSGHGKTLLTSNISKVGSKEYKPGSSVIRLFSLSSTLRINKLACSYRKPEPI